MRTMQILILIALYLLRGISSKEKCEDGYGPTIMLSALKVSDFAIPWGTESLHNFCMLLMMFYQRYAAGKYSMDMKCEPVFEYFHKARQPLFDLCSYNGTVHTEYDRYSCYETSEVYKASLECWRSAPLDVLTYFKVPESWPRDHGDVDDCLRNTQIIFCMAFRLATLCDDLEATRFFLDFSRLTKMPSIYCDEPYLQDVFDAMDTMRRNLLKEQLFNIPQITKLTSIYCYVPYLQDAFYTMDTMRRDLLKEKLINSNRVTKMPPIYCYTPYLQDAFYAMDTRRNLLK